MPEFGEVRALVESSAEEIFAAAVRQGMTTLHDDGMRLALTGVSSGKSGASPGSTSADAGVSALPSAGAR